MQKKIVGKSWRYIVIVFSIFQFILISTCLPQSHSSKNLFYLKNISHFPFGASVNPDFLKSKLKYYTTVTNEFNSITPENSMKMNRLEPMKDSFNWIPADYLISFAKANEMRVHGHTLIWHRSLPQWVLNYNGDSCAWANLLKGYITTVVRHFKGEVKSWDVINEAFEDDGTYRKSIWYEHLNENYILLSFQYAHEADPKALLFYNDYNQELSDKKTDAILNLTKKLKERSVPINGLGLQMHINIDTDNNKIYAALEKLSYAGLLVHISELTISVNNIKGNKYFIESNDLIRKQMQKFADVINLYKRTVPKTLQYGITTWNVGDNDTFLNAECLCKDFPQMFDTNYNKKPFYDRIIKSLRKE